MGGSGEGLRGTCAVIRGCGQVAGWAATYAVLSGCAVLSKETGITLAGVCTADELLALIGCAMAAAPQGQQWLPLGAILRQCWRRRDAWVRVGFVAACAILNLSLGFTLFIPVHTSLSLTLSPAIGFVF